MFRRIRYAVAVLAFSAAMLMNAGCTVNENGTPAEGVTSTPTVSQTANATPTATPATEFSPTITPSPTLTPAPTLTPTPTPIPTPAPSERPVSVAEMWSESFLSATFFDPDKSVADQLSDRKDYLLTFDGCLSEKEADTLVRWINLGVINEKMTQESYDSLGGILKKVFTYNQSHSDNMIPFSVLGINLSDKDKMAYNNLQCISLEMTNNLPKNSITDKIYEYKDSKFFLQLSYGGEMVLTLFVRDEDHNSSKYVNLKTLDTGCRIISYLYSIEVLKPYKASVMSVRRTCIAEYLEQEWDALKNE